MTASALRIESSSGSHEGQVRERNEDSFLAAGESGLWVVADGMGGHERGDWASSTIIAALSRAELGADFDEGCHEIADAIHSANAAIFEESQQRGVQMGSTVVVLFVRERRFVIFWVGDSRAYLLRGGEFHQLTRDHTQVQELVDRGILRGEEAEEHPMSHVLARAVGVTEAVEVDAVQDEIEPGDIFLLCSDGLHGYVPQPEIIRHLTQGPVEDVADRLVAATLERGAPDNITAVAVRVTEPTLLAFSATAGSS